MNANAIEKIEDRIDKDIATTMTVGGRGVSFQNAGEVMEYAKMMAVSGSAVPKHLRGQPGACLGILDDAIRFEMSPYALARKSYFVNDNLAYEAQVLAAIVLARAPLKKRPDVSYKGEGAERKCIVTYTFHDGDVKQYESPFFKNISPKNSPLWKTDPDQQQAYYSLRAGARRHFPDVLLGIYDYEEMRAMTANDITPAPKHGDELLKRLEGRQIEPEDGFDAACETIDQETSSAKDRTDEEEQEPAADAQHAAEASEEEDLPSEPSDATESEPEDDEPSFPGDLPLEDETEASPVDEYVDRLSSMGEAKDVHALTNEFMDTISNLSKEHQDRAETARVKRLKAIAEESIGG